MAPVLVIGAGPAGLAVAAELSRRGVLYRLVERGPTLAHSWETVYDSLTLHTGRHMSTLPGMSYPPGTPIFPGKRSFLEYLRAYADRFRLRAETRKAVIQLVPDGGGWRAAFADGEVMEAPAVIVATGIVANPRVPALPGREQYGGHVMHSVEYQRPDPFVGQRVLLVGVGNSGAEIGAELAAAGAMVTVLVRSGQNVVPKTIGPFPAQYVRYVAGWLPRRAQELIFARVQRRIERRYGPPVFPRAAMSTLDAIPMIGFGLVEAIRSGRATVVCGGLDHLTPTGAVFTDRSHADFDAIILATGFAAATDFLGDRIRRDARGFALRTDRVTSADQRGLWFVGHNYDHTGGLTNIRKDAPLAAVAVQRYLRDRSSGAGVVDGGKDVIA